MEEICLGKGATFEKLGKVQDTIGWRRFMEGMIATEISKIQRQYLAVSGSLITIEKWTTGLIIKLMEIAHGQWIYRNYKVHDKVAGSLATAKKEEIQLEIEKQRELGDDGLLPEARYLAEINLERLEGTSGGKQHYWLLAIRAARKDKILWDREVERSRSAT